jgi:N-acetylmuramoyl-L-alanine amidase
MWKARGLKSLTATWPFRLLCAFSLSLIFVSGLVLVGCRGTNSQVLSQLPPPPVFVSPPSPSPSVSAEPDVAEPKSIQGRTIVIDAGHGGKDPGALGRGGLTEKQIVLSIALEVARLLEIRGAEVVATRASDQFISLDERASMAERSRADLFVSIHADAARNKNASGVGAFIYTSAHKKSQLAAHRIIRAVERAGLESRGIRRRNFHVLREHSRPAVLIECGFLTNAGDRRRLNNESYRKKLAAVLVQGIVDHLGR